MRLLVRMLDPRETSETRPGRTVRRYSPDRFPLIETTVVRLVGPVRGGSLRAYGFLPAKYAHLAFRHLYRSDGMYLFDVAVKRNRRTLAPFLASGLVEMDVRDIE